jgi:hypothetical protein
MKKYPFLSSQGENSVKLSLNVALVLFLLVGLISAFSWIILVVGCLLGGLLVIEGVTGAPSLDEELSLDKVVLTLCTLVILVVLWILGIIAGRFFGPISWSAVAIVIFVRVVIEGYAYLFYVAKPTEP